MALHFFRPLGRPLRTIPQFVRLLGAAKQRFAA
jgi:hypothetical protein